MPLHQRVPKLRGFKNPFRVEYQAVNLDTIEASGLAEVTPETLLELGLVGKKSLVKLLARGEVTRVRRLQRLPSRRPVARSSACRCRSPCVRRPAATR